MLLPLAAGMVLLGILPHLVLDLADTSVTSLTESIQSAINHLSEI